MKPKKAASLRVTSDLSLTAIEQAMFDIDRSFRDNKPITDNNTGVIYYILKISPSGFVGANGLLNEIYKIKDESLVAPTVRLKIELNYDCDEWSLHGIIYYNKYEHEVWSPAA